MMETRYESLEFESVEIQLPKGEAVLQTAEYEFIELPTIIDSDEWFD